ncbi:probable G-protein coupled receptor 141 isoform X2 [Bufo gargarizans]|nr:probable G-protein coupled receptor 141 isoform X2 [Bufo gargarizans]XP_044150623.1 probable G-protein coupled receptor 141 isoform X2 [Bufo gargarizans]
MVHSVNETTNQTICFIQPDVANGILIALYFTAMIGGTIGIIIMVFLLSRTNTRSMTITAIINLLVIHGIFILTIPFRIAYYIQKEWIFQFTFCKIISSMIHIHMYLSFIFYVALLSIRYISYFKQKDKIEFYRKMHSVVASAALWIIISLVVMPVFFFQYGAGDEKYESTQCFFFHKEIKRPSVIILNYITIAVIFLVVCILLIVQIFIIVKIVKKLKRTALDHQEFWVQLKSLFFILVMVICLFPYHMFRIYYIEHINECFYYNEIFLGITALSCLDLLSFAVQTYFQKVFQHMTCLSKCL